MIRIIDSFKLALTKFKQKKVRTIMSGCSIGVGVVIILVILVGLSGLKGVLKKVYRNSLYGRYFVVEYEDKANLSTSENEYIKKHSDFKIKDVDINYIYNNYVSYHTSSAYKESEKIFTINLGGDGSAENSANSMGSLYFLEDEYVKDYLYKGYSFRDEYNGVVPVILSTEYVFSTLVSKDNVWYFESSQSNGESFEKLKETLDNVIGKEYTFLSYEYSSQKENIVTTPTEIKVKVVGFYSSDMFDNLIDRNGAIFPKWAIEKNSLFKNILNTDNSRMQIIYELNNKKDRDNMAKKYDNVEVIMSFLELFEVPMQYIKYISYGVGGFFLIISSLITFFTINKVVSDSKREIGVFRAVGSQKKDIRSIYFNYSFIVANIGFFIGIVMAYGFNTTISLIWGRKLFYSIAIYGNNFDYNPPLLLFIGFPIIEIMIVYFIVILSSYIAAAIPSIRASNMDVVKAIRDE